MRQLVWYVCSNCGKGNHIRFDNGLAQVVVLQGAPGYEYDPISSTNEQSLQIRVDSGFLHIWLHGKHFEIKERS